MQHKKTWWEKIKDYFKGTNDKKNRNQRVALRKGTSSSGLAHVNHTVGPPTGERPSTEGPPNIYVGNNEERLTSIEERMRKQKDENIEKDTWPDTRPA